MPHSNNKESVQPIFDILNKVVKSLQKAEQKYFFKESINPSHFSPIGPLFNNKGIWIYPIETRNGVSIDSKEFLSTLKNEFVPKNKKLLKDKKEYFKVVFLTKRKIFFLKIWKKIEKEGDAFSLKIQSSVNQVLKITMKEAPTSVSFTKLEAKNLREKTLKVESKGL